MVPFHDNCIGIKHFSMLVNFQWLQFWEVLNSVRILKYFQPLPVTKIIYRLLLTKDKYSIIVATWLHVSFTCKYMFIKYTNLSQWGILWIAWSFLSYLYIWGNSCEGNTKSWRNILCFIQFIAYSTWQFCNTCGMKCFLRFVITNHFQPSSFKCCSWVPPCTSWIFTSDSYTIQLSIGV